MKDDVRLFRIREDAIKDEFKSARDKPLTDEETEQMWKNVSGSVDIFDFRKNKTQTYSFFRIVHREAESTRPSLRSATVRGTPGWTCGERGTPR